MKCVKESNSFFHTNAAISTADAPVFGTPARSPRPSPLSGAGAAAIAATIAGGTTPARLPFAASDAVAVDAGGRGPVTSAAKPAYGTLGQPQQQPFAAANGTSGSTSSGGGQQALHDGVAAGTSRGEAPPQPSEAAKAKSPFGAGAASAPVFGIAAMRSPSLGTPKSANAASAGAAAATHKRGRDDAEPQAGCVASHATALDPLCHSEFHRDMHNWWTGLPTMRC